MIEITARISGSKELALIRISNVDPKGHYLAEIVVDRGEAVGVHNRMVYSFPRKEYNVLALLKQVLATLEEDELRIDGDFTYAGSSDLARRLGPSR